MKNEETSDDKKSMTGSQGKYSLVILLKQAKGGNWFWEEIKSYLWQRDTLYWQIMGSP